jgi:uncharacterized protein YkwD
MKKHNTIKNVYWLIAALLLISMQLTGCGKADSGSSDAGVTSSTTDPSTSDPTEDPTDPLWGGRQPTPTPSRTSTPAPVASATPAPTAPPSTSTGEPCKDPEGNADREQICLLVNIERAKVGAAPLTLTPAITAVAQAYAVKMKTEGFFSHTSPDGTTMSSRLKAGGVSYGYAGENIAQGQSGPTTVMNAWMNSSGHKANILNTHYKKIGIGAYQKTWVQDFTD